MKKKYVIAGLVVAAAGVVALLLAWKVEEQKQNPVERYANQQNDEERKTEFTYQDVKYEFFSYEKIEGEDMTTQTSYAGEYFFEGEVPVTDFEGMTYVTDYEAVEAESPEIKDLYENPDEYTWVETDEILARNEDIINKYTTIVHYEINYVFVRCRLSNTLKVEKEVNLNEIRFALSSQDMEQFSLHDNICYFDAPVHTEGDDRDHRFFWYTLQPGETLDCVIGFKVEEELENPEYYFGIDDLQMEMDGMNPVEGKYMIKLSDLEEVENEK